MRPPKQARMHIYVIESPEAQAAQRYLCARLLFLRRRLEGCPYPDALTPFGLPGSTRHVIVPGLPLADLTDAAAHAAFTYALRDLHSRLRVTATRHDLTPSVAYHAPPSGAAYLTRPGEGETLLSHLQRSGGLTTHAHTPAGTLVVTNRFTAPVPDADVLWTPIP